MRLNVDGKLTILYKLAKTEKSLKMPTRICSFGAGVSMGWSCLKHLEYSTGTLRPYWMTAWTEKFTWSYCCMLTIKLPLKTYLITSCSEHITKRSSSCAPVTFSDFKKLWGTIVANCLELHKYRTDSFDNRFINNILVHVAVSVRLHIMSCPNILPKTRRFSPLSVFMNWWP